MGFSLARRAPTRRAKRAFGAALVILVAASAVPWLAPVAQAQVSRAALTDPPANVPRTRAMALACSNGPEPCQEAVLQAIDQARAAEGIGPLELPANFDSITTAEQLLVLANLERIDRGLPGFIGLSSKLDTLARSAALAGNDPNGPSGTTWGSNWAGGEASALLADYDWVYDDGPGSPNMDCTNALANGCWDHRRNVLGNYGPRPAMGAAMTMMKGVTSMTELFTSGPSRRARLHRADHREQPTCSPRSPRDRDDAWSAEQRRADRQERWRLLPGKCFCERGWRGLVRHAIL